MKTKQDWRKDKEELKADIANLENFAKELMRSVDEELQEAKSRRENEWQMLIQNDETTDVKFLVGDGAEQMEILAHRFVLVRESKEFRKLLLQRKDYFNNPIPLNQYRLEEFKTFLKVIYLGVGDLPSAEDEDFVTDIRGILKVAKDFQPDFIPLCKSLLENAIKENWKIALKALEMEEDPGIISVALRTICRNAEEIFKSPEFLLLPLEYMKEIFKLDELFVGDETKIFEAVIRWAENRIGDVSSLKMGEKGKKIRTEIYDLLYLIRFPLMTQDYFVNKVAEQNILEEKEESVITKFLMFSSHGKPSDPAPFSCKQRRNHPSTTEDSGSSSINANDDDSSEGTSQMEMEQTPIQDKASTSAPETGRELKPECESDLSDDDCMIIEVNEEPRKIVELVNLS